jgi:hypothetical protein
MDTSDREFFRLSPFLDFVRSELSRLTTRHSAAFALHCGERLFPDYARFAASVGSSDAPRLRAVLDDLWLRAGSSGPTDAEVDEIIARIQSIDLREEDCCPDWDAAVDAVGTALLAAEVWGEQPAVSAAKAGANVLNRTERQLWDEASGARMTLSAGEVQAIHELIEDHPATRSARDQILGLVEFLKRATTLSGDDLRVVRELGETAARGAGERA